MRRARCLAHGLYEGVRCPICSELSELRARAESAEALVTWLACSRRAWVEVANGANYRLSQLHGGRPVHGPSETVPDVLMTMAERMAPVIAAKRWEIAEFRAACARGAMRDDLDDYLDDVNCSSGYARASSYELRARGEADDEATLKRLEAELKELLERAGVS